jgi:CRP/FNR family cyclic AMP-dependent transcriptional regulator
MSQSITAILSLAEFFDGLTDAELELVAAICEPETYQKGRVLFEENESSDELYVIGSGAIEILMNPSVSPQQKAVEPVVVAELVSGQACGEIALVDRGIRSATARISKDDTYVLRLPREGLMSLCDTHPELGYKVVKNLAADLAFKMRVADLTIRQYQLMLSKSENRNQ